jgi:hypothetical protein
MDLHEVFRMVQNNLRQMTLGRPVVIIPMERFYLAMAPMIE